MTKKKIALTFDYELFLGKDSGSLESCILYPTNLILECLEKHNKVATFFIDSSYLLRLSSSKNKLSDYQNVIEQIGKIINSGSRVELHIHPHWINAIETEKNWVFNDFSRYRIHSFDSNEIQNIFFNCFNLLENICRRFDSGYNIKIFRAGGFCLQDFQKLKTAFDLIKINIDSSVLPRMKYISEYHFYNYKMLKKVEPYRFNEEPTKECHNGNYIELPITTYYESITELLLKKFFSKHKIFSTFGDGIGVPTKPMSIVERLSLRYKYFTLDSAFDTSIFDKICNSRFEKINILSHPKSMNIKSIDLLEMLLNESNFDFVNLIDFADGI